MTKEVVYELLASAHFQKIFCATIALWWVLESSWFARTPLLAPIAFFQGYINTGLSRTKQYAQCAPSSTVEYRKTVCAKQYAQYAPSSTVEYRN